MRIGIPLAALLLLAGPAWLSDSALAAKITVDVNGLESPLDEAAVAAVEITQYADRDVSAAQAQRLHDRAEGQIQTALEAYGYYHVKISGELRKVGENFVSDLKIDRGEPVTIAESKVIVDGNAMERPRVMKAVDGFHPRDGEVLDHAVYERSKTEITGALFSAGYLDALLERHRVEVTRDANSAVIDLYWKAGPRYKFGETTFDDSQFDEHFLERYIPYEAGDWYSQEELLQLQQGLIDANYFSIVQVQPDSEKAVDGVVPINVLLAPAKRNVYTGGVFVGTDTGVGVRGGVERRWVNRQGHKLKFEALVAQRLKTVTGLYTIPKPGRDNHSWNFGATYRDENTDTSQSKTLRLATTDSRIWRGWTRTYGLQFLTGNFEVADIKGKTTLLYPEASLAKKYADNPNFPRKGWSLTFAARAGLEGVLSDTNFTQLTADAKWITGIGKLDRFITRGSFGYTQVGDFNALPPELRFFAGGDRSIRGFGYQTVGPLNADGKVIGGETLLVASAEYEHYFTPTWGMAGFIDAGDAFRGTKFEAKVGAGFGLRWRSPVGMVRVDLGTPVRGGGPDDSSIQLHVVIGPDL